MHQSDDPIKTEVYDISHVHITSDIKVLFQVDGRYLENIKEAKATIVEDVPEIMLSKELLTVVYTNQDAGTFYESFFV